MSLIWTRRQLAESARRRCRRVYAVAPGVRTGWPPAPEEPASSSCSIPTPVNTRTWCSSAARSTTRPRSRRLKKLLRDHRNGEMHDIDPRLYDQLFDAGALPRSAIRTSRSSPAIARPRATTRCPRSRAAVSRRNRCTCRAAPWTCGSRNCDCAEVARPWRWRRSRGGVGYYERSDFVHIDTGAFRTWIR